jgi:hypothetical protein
LELAKKCETPKIEKSQIKRRLIQLISALIYNIDVANWFTGKIPQTGLKKVCVPGLNCY